jgi:hypothetical protein
MACYGYRMTPEELLKTITAALDEITSKQASLPADCYVRRQGTIRASGDSAGVNIQLANGQVFRLSVEEIES